MIRRWLWPLPLAALVYGCVSAPPGSHPAAGLPIPSEPAARPDRDGPPPQPVDLSQVPDAVPRDEPRSRYGNPESYVVFGERYYTLKSADNFVERGIASWYGSKFHGKRTSSGEPFDMYAMTAAHRQLPLPVYAQVTNLENGRRIIVRVNDRGPFAKNRVMDLSYAAASKLGMLQKGTAPVEIRVITAADYAAGQAARPVTEAGGRIEYYVQLGAFADLGNAERLRDRITDVVLRNRAQIQPVSTGQGQLHRLRVGPALSVAEADQLFNALTRLGFSDAQVVIQNQTP